MLFRRFLIPAVLAQFVCLAYSPLFAQNSGVEVDAEGVLRTRVWRDPSGALMRRRVAEARASLERDLGGPSNSRKISLNRLEAIVDEYIARGERLPDEINYLAGLTKIQHVFYYPETGDIVIAGPAEGFVHDLSGRVVGMHSGKSVLELRDLVVALRAYAPGVEGPKTIACSIDPTKEGLTRMQQYLARVGGRALPGDTGALVRGLRGSLGMQTVTIRGVSPKTHFAQVLVEADYRMKLIGIGLERPAVKITSYVEGARPASVARNAMQRWYFTPNYECIKVSDDEWAMELVGEGVKLIGQDEMVTARGGRVASGRVDGASQKFVQSFTRSYAALAAKEPVFAQLRNLIDMAVAAAFIQRHDYYGQADWKMATFGSEERFPVATLNAPAQVETAVNAIWKGRTLMTPIGGGVNMQPRLALNSDRLLSDETGAVSAARKEIDIKSIAADRWWWD